MTADVALKEWQVVCNALARGEQSILLRKGGIQEGPGGFSIEHRRFALLPTRLHQKTEMLKPPYRERVDGGDVEGGVEGGVEPEVFHLTHAGEITNILTIDSREVLDRLNELHVWDEPYLKMRWNYRPERPLYLLVVRAYALDERFDLKNTYEVAGCRSWVPLKGPLEASRPVQSDADHAAVVGRVLALLTPEH